MISCHALVALLCPFVCSHLNISPFEWYSKCWTSSLVIRISSFHVLLCMVRVLKPVWIGHVDKGRVVFHHFSHSSIKQKLCNLQKSMEQFMPLSLFVFTSVRLRFKWSVQTKLYQEISFSHAFMSSSPVKRLVAGKRLVQHGFGFECLGCWPCRTAKVASSSLAIPSKSLEQLVTLMIWKKCWPQTEFCSFCFGTFSEETWQRLSTANIFAICAVSSWFAFMSNTVP